ncbi:MAG: hypothetical protein IJS94_02810, partial [Clostridia bacterium]|nr:hypothetical protein [Clostridia bacterium]
MKTDNEIKETIYKRRDRYIAEKKIRTKKIIGAAACFVVIAAGGIGITAYVRNNAAQYSSTDGGDSIPTKIA